MARPTTANWQNGEQTSTAKVKKRSAKWPRRRDLHEMQLDFRQMNASFAYAAAVVAGGWCANG